MHARQRAKPQRSSHAATAAALHSSHAARQRVEAAGDGPHLQRWLVQTAPRSLRSTSRSQRPRASHTRPAAPHPWRTRCALGHSRCEFSARPIHGASTNNTRHRAGLSEALVLRTPAATLAGPAFLAMLPGRGPRGCWFGPRGAPLQSRHHSQHDVLPSQRARVRTRVRSPRTAPVQGGSAACCCGRHSESCLVVWAKGTCAQSMCLLGYEGESEICKAGKGKGKERGGERKACLRRRTWRWTWRRSVCALDDTLPCRTPEWGWLVWAS